MKLKISGLFVVLIGLVLVGCRNPVNPQPSSAKAITAFSFESPAATGNINESNHTIAVTVPYGTDVTALKPTIAYTGVSISPASGTAQDYTSPVTYTVKAEDSSTQEYTVTVTVAPATAKAITEFNFTSPAATGIIDETNHTIAVEVPYNTDVSSLTPSITITGVSVSPTSGVAQDFSNPVTYTVKAEDSSTQAYTVTVTAALATAKAITAFSFSNPAATGIIDETNHTIAVEVPYNTDVTALTPTITITGVSVNPASGTAQDFTNPVTYTVEAADGSTQAYTVTVTKAAPSSDNAITAFNFTSPAATGTITEAAHTIAVEVPYNTDVTALTPTITITGVSVNPASGTIQDFSNPVTYTVTAEDSSTQAYQVTVTVAANPAKAITAFNFTSLAATGTINETAHTIAVEVPYNTDVTALTPTITITGVSVNPASGAVQNFTSPVTYTVTAEDSSTQAYTVTVTEPFLVTFDSQGGSAVPSQEVFVGGSVTEPAIPTKTGNGFGGWYKDSTYQNLWDFSLDTVNSDLTLYAKWYAATDGLDYTLINGNTEYEVASGTAITESSIIIPDYWNAKKVTAIGASGFNGSSNLTSITIPSTVTAIGNYAFGGCTLLKSITIPSGVTSIGEGTFMSCSSMSSITIPDTVTSIGDNAFQYCSAFTSIVLPTGITSIGNYAFSNCVSLAAITLPSGVTSIGNRAFQVCPSLKSIALPTGITAIGDYTFNSCNSLQSITIPDGVTSIGEGAFYGCNNLTGVTLPNGITSIGNSVFQNCIGLKSIILPSGVTSIGNSAFQACTGLTSVTLPSGVTSIGDAAFQDCSILTGINLPDGLASIGASAFAGCSGFTSITLPNGITSIGNNMFQGCTGLTSITIPNSVTSIGNYAFYVCNALGSITLPSGVTSIGDKAFYNCSSLTNITLSSALTSIGDYAFYGCSSLVSITLPSGVTSIGSGAFEYCSGLTSVTLPSSVTSITFAAFMYCSGLTSITIPSSVTSITSYAFYGCSSLTTLNMEPLTAPGVGISVFTSVSGCALHIFSGANGYDVSPWTDNPPFSSILADLP